MEEKKDLKNDIKKRPTKKLESNSATLRAGFNETELDTFEDAVPSLSKEEREAQPLATKIENILPRIFIS